MIKVTNPKSMGHYSNYGAGGPKTKKVMPSMKGTAGKLPNSGGNVVGSKKYC